MPVISSLLSLKYVANLRSSWYVGSAIKILSVAYFVVWTNELNSTCFMHCCPQSECFNKKTHEWNHWCQLLKPFPFQLHANLSSVRSSLNPQIFLLWPSSRSYLGIPEITGRKCRKCLTLKTAAHILCREKLYWSCKPSPDKQMPCCLNCRGCWFSSCRPR